MLIGCDACRGSNPFHLDFHVNFYKNGELVFVGDTNELAFLRKCN